jgi:hypothetical protein
MLCVVNKQASVISMVWVGAVSLVEMCVWRIEMCVSGALS